MFLTFSLEQTTVLSTHHAYHDKAPLYWTAITYILWQYLGLKFIHVMNLSKSANTASECYNGVIIFAT